MPARNAPEPGGRDVSVVLAVKRLDDAKSRLADVVPSTAMRRRLVAAMLADTVDACHGAAVRSVTVVSPDPAVHALAADAGFAAVDEPAAIDGLSALNSALAAGISAAPRSALTVALQADLAAVDAVSLGEALDAAAAVVASGHAAAFVADHTGDGTALLAMPADHPVQPRFGPSSASAHRDAGAVELDPDRTLWPRLRTDVDTADDLAAVAALGPGARVAAVLASAREQDSTASIVHN